MGELGLWRMEFRESIPPAPLPSTALSSEPGDAGRKSAVAGMVSAGVSLPARDRCLSGARRAFSVVAPDLIISRGFAGLKSGSLDPT